MAVAILDGTGVVGFAAWADNAVWPAFGLKKVNLGLFVGELFEEFKGTEVAFVVVVDGDWLVGHVIFLSLELLW